MSPWRFIIPMGLWVFIYSTYEKNAQGESQKMNIYFSKKVRSVYFFESTVTISTSNNEYNFFGAMAYIIHCMCESITSLRDIAIALKRKVKVEAEITSIEQKVVENTLQSKDNSFLFSETKENYDVEVYNTYGKRFPQILHLELTSSCNLNCEHCYKDANKRKKYISLDELKRKIYLPFMNKTQVIHFTGGEPTINPHFEEIVNCFSQAYTLQLTTNGTNLLNYPMELFKQFQGIDISLYGINNDEYFLNTKSNRSFDNLILACEKLSSSKIPFRHTVVLNHRNVSKMEDYLNFSISLGATSFGYALPVKSGRLLNSDSAEWSFTTDEIDMIYRTFRALNTKYKDKIDITPWHRSNYASALKHKNPFERPMCSAGSKAWWMSEDFIFRPCAFLPAEYLSLNYDEFMGYVHTQTSVDWRSAYERLSDYCKCNNISIADICTVF